MRTKAADDKRTEIREVVREILRADLSCVNAHYGSSARTAEFRSQALELQAHLLTHEAGELSKGGERDDAIKTLRRAKAAADLAMRSIATIADGDRRRRNAQHSFADRLATTNAIATWDRAKATAEAIQDRIGELE